MKKIVAVALAVTTLSTLTFGSSVVAEEPIEIRISTTFTPGATSGVGEAMEVLIEEFEAEHPNVKIIHDAQSTNDLRTKLTVEFAAGTPADISWCPTNYAREFMKDDLIIDWAEIINSEEHPEWREWFSDATIASLTEEDGTILLAPFEASIDGLYYNKEMFEEHGWEVPTTWDELISLCGEINEAGIAPLVTGGKDGRFAWLCSALLVRSTGLDNFRELCLGNAITEWDNPEYGFTTAVEKFKELVDANAYPQGVMGMSATEADQLFATGQAAMYYEGAWKVNNFITAGGEEFADKIGRADFPAITEAENGNANTRVGGCITGLCIASGLDEEKEALCIELVTRMASPEFNVPIMETPGGYMYAGNVDYNKENVTPAMVDLIDAYRSAESFIPSMDCIAPPAVDLAIKNTAFPGIITGEYDVNSAITEVEKAAEDYVATGSSLF